MRLVSTEKKIVEKNIFFLNLVVESWYETVVLVFFYNISQLMPSFVHLIALCLPKMDWESWISESRSQGSTEHPMKSEPQQTGSKCNSLTTEYCIQT